MGPIAQSVEQRTFNPWVDSSSLSGPTHLAQEMATRRSNGEGTVWYAKTEGRFRAQYPDANGHRRTITGTVEELLVSFIKSLEGKREPKTIERYALDVNNYLVPTLGKLKLNQLTSDIIEIAYSTIKRDFVLSDNSMAHCHATLRGAIRRGMKHKRIAVNPLANVDSQKRKRVQIQPLSELQMLGFIT